MRKQKLRKQISISIVLIIMLSVLHLYFSGALPFLKQEGDTLIYARSGDSVTLDPAMSQDEESYKVISNIFEGLVRFKPGTTEVEPCLAEAWQVSADGREWTFYLRKNVKFHDGTPFNAEAVQFNVERQMPPNRTENMAYASFVFGMVESVKTINPYTVKFSLKYPYAPFLNNLAMPAAAPIVSPAAASALGDNFSVNPIGTGPFKFGSWEKGKKLILNKNLDYWGKQPQCNRLVFTVVNNSRLRSLALKMHMADIIDEITPQDARLLEQSGYSIIKKPGLDLSYLGFFTDKKPFDNPEVRRAISMSIDREQIIATLFHSESHVADGPLPPGVLGYDPGIRLHPYDPIGAKELLARNGFGGNPKITIITYTDPRIYNPAGGEKLAEAIRADLALVGVDVEIKAYSWQQYKEALYKEEGNAFLYGWISDNGDPDNFLYTLLSSSQIGNGLNSSHYRNDEIDMLLAKAQQEKDRLSREELYHKAVKIIVQDAPWVFLNNSVNLTAISPKIEGLFLPTGNNSLATVTKIN
ncbi:MAG: Periplasmic dipeptide transport protein precursor [Pelotomaculum sp. PtaB.Bin013]|uniref:ABC transporter substrate-binding protein n=1 Tax=Pelotomaculum isophthalicicum JI TaxID=947010 RepID=A0A9X4H068_9FIRM|nr:ABC transporter substrate-binding protein [Pelotomaculum isophthalicicum]MDF9409560.1 ABC transporter substrate-binding protein [Pelotomaculum isophthalicicum JI]OPX91207.1 MAG: Periplasmic dipeptide transport protein precursor [Pelotomaculum sp. PtaB.Bin013]